MISATPAETHHQGSNDGIQSPNDPNVDLSRVSNSTDKEGRCEIFESSEVLRRRRRRRQLLLSSPNIQAHHSSTRADLVRRTELEDSGTEIQRKSKRRRKSSNSEGSQSPILVQLSLHTPTLDNSEIAKEMIAIDTQCLKEAGRETSNEEILIPSDHTSTDWENESDPESNDARTKTSDANLENEMFRYQGKNSSLWDTYHHKDKMKDEDISVIVFEDGQHIVSTKGIKGFTPDEIVNFHESKSNEDRLLSNIPISEIQIRNNLGQMNNHWQKEEEKHLVTFCDSLNLLSLYGINRRLIGRQRRSAVTQRTRLAALSGCLYHVPPSVPGPPGAIPEHTPIWARVTNDMPLQPLNVRERTFPWHLARIVYCRPAQGLSLGFIHRNGEAENIDEYLLEWAIGPPHLRVLNSTSSVTAPITRNQNQERRSASRHTISSPELESHPRISVSKKNDIPNISYTSHIDTSPDVTPTVR